MKIYRTHIVTQYQQNGPDSYAELVKIHELSPENINDKPTYVKESASGRLEKITNERFEKLSQNEIE